MAVQTALGRAEGVVCKKGDEVQQPRCANCHVTPQTDSQLLAAADARALLAVLLPDPVSCQLMRSSLSCSECPCHRAARHTRHGRLALVSQGDSSKPDSTRP